jgi:acetoacetyl-CoA synthetase
MRVSGIVIGDRVTAVIANTSRAISICLVALSIGAIWTNISPDFGARAIVERLGQVKPRLAFVNVEVRHNGKRRGLMGAVGEWARVVGKEEGFESAIAREINWETFWREEPGGSWSSSSCRLISLLSFSTLLGR